MKINYIHTDFFIEDIYKKNDTRPSKGQESINLNTKERSEGLLIMKDIINFIYKKNKNQKRQDNKFYYFLYLQTSLKVFIKTIFKYGGACLLILFFLHFCHAPLYLTI